MINFIGKLKHKFLKYRYKFLLALSILVTLTIYSCKKDIDPRPNTTTINLTVIDAQSNILPGAKVALYYDFAVHQSSYEQYDYTNAYVADVADDGTVTFEDIPAFQEYYISANYQSDQVFAGATVNLDNQNQSFKIPFIPEGGQTVDAFIKLTPREGVVTFYTNSAIANVQPIKVNIDNIERGVLTSAINNTPDPFTPGAISVLLKTGTYNYFTVGNSACAWTGQIEVTSGINSPILLDKCSFGTVGFYSSSSVPLTSPIDVVIGVNDTVGAVNVPSLGTPTNCSAANLITKELKPGTYTYFARNSDECAWSGEFEIIDGECKIIELKECR